MTIRSFGMEGGLNQILDWSFAMFGIIRPSDTGRW